MVMKSDETSQIVSDVLRKLVPGKETVFDVKEMVDDDGEFQRVSIGMRDLEPIVKQKDIDRAKARCHTFHSIQAFTGYLLSEGNESTLVLADVDAGKIACVLSEDDEEDREEIYFQAKLHPLFAPWRALLGNAIPVLDFALFVMKYRSAVLEPNGRELALMFTQIKASKNVTKRVGIGNKSLNGVTVELLIGSEKNQVEVELPEKIVISAPIYLDTDPVRIEIDMLVTEANDRLVVFLTASTLEAVQFDLFKGMVDSIGEATGFTTGLGKIEHRDWRVIK